MAERIGEGFVEARLDTSRIDQDAARLERDLASRLDATGRRLQQTGRTLTRRMTLPVIGLGTAVARTAMTYESSMNRVGALTGAVGDEFDRLGDRAQELGRTTQFSAAQAADAMGFLAMAGFEVNEIYDAMPGVLNLAAAGQIQLAEAADIASNILQGMGLEVSELDHLIDVMAATITSTNTDMRQLGEAMVPVAPIAASAGIEVEELSAAIGLLGDAGIQGSMAGTSLRGAIARLLSPSAQAAEVIGRLGLNVQTAEGGLRPLNEIIEQLEDSAATTGDMMVLFGQRAGPAMAALVGRGADALRSQTQVALESSGRAAEIAERQMEGLQGSVLRMRAAFEGLAIAIGTSGLLDMLASFAESLAAGAQRLSETNPALLNMGIIAAGVLAAVGPLAWAVGSLMRVVAAFVAPVKAAAVAFGSLAAAKSALATASVGAQLGMLGFLKFALNPVVIALAAATVAVGLWAKSKADARRRVEELRQTLDETTGAITDQTRAQVANRLEQEGALRAAQQLGIGLETVVDAALGNASAMREVNEVLDRYDPVLAAERTQGMGGAIHGARSAADDLRAAFGLLSPELDQAIDVQQRLSEAMGEGEQSAGEQALAFRALEAEAGAVGVATSGAAEGVDEATREILLAIDPTGELAGEFEDLADGATDAASALDEYMDAARRASDPVFRLFDALESVEEAQRDHNEAVAEFGPSSEEAEAAAINLFRRLEDLEQAALDGDLSWEAFASRLDLWVARGDITAAMADTIRDRVAGVRGEVDRLPRDVQIRLRIEGHREANRNLNEIWRAAERAAGDYTVRMRVTSSGLRTFRELEAAAGRQHGGPVQAGVPFIVGERRPEVFVPDQDGTIVPSIAEFERMVTPRLGHLGSVTGHDGAAIPAPVAVETNETYSPTYIIHGEPSRDTIDELRHRERVAYLERR